MSLILVLKCLVVFGTTLISAVTVKWLPNSNFNLPENFIGKKLPCSKQTVVFPRSITGSVDIPPETEVRGFILPENGELILEDLLTFGANPAETNCTEEYAYYLDTAVRSWSQADVWSSPKFNKATPDSDRVPCFNDVVEFPEDTKFTVILPKATQHVKEVRVGSEIYYSSHEKFDMNAFDNLVKDTVDGYGEDRIEYYVGLSPEIEFRRIQLVVVDKEEYEEHWCKMLFADVFLTLLCISLSYGCLYDIYTGELLSADLQKFYESNGLLETCAVNVKPCYENEWRRVDGSCNNLESPARATFFSPMTRVLPADFFDGYKARKAESGEELPPPRQVRLKLLNETRSTHKDLNNNVPGYAAFAYIDIGSIHDNENLLGKTTYCCKKEHMNDFACTPNIISDDDPVFGPTDIRCMNATRPVTYQMFQCTQDPVPSPIKKATTPFDLSQIYNSKGEGDRVLRSFKGGELAVEEENGALFPPNGPTASCPTNVLPDETRCFEHYYGTFIPVTLLTTWYVRHHNYIASNLAKLNPCWNDELLYQTARDINIAFYKQVYFYEWNTALQGRDNLIKAGVISKDKGCRDLYDSKMSPEITLEFNLFNRWFHLLQESKTMLYDVHGNFIEEFKSFDATFRTGLLANNMSSFTQSMFRAPCHGGDGTVDPELANSALPAFQRAIDALSGDISKNRNFGLPAYVDYILHFLGIEINTFEDLYTAGLMTKEKVRLLKSTYAHPRDIDVIAGGGWCEKNMKGGNIPLTVANILNDNTLRAIKSDRHWYERCNRPHAFTEKQLKEIRKSTLSCLMCAVGDGVTEVPKKAFYNISPKNPLVTCDKIKKLNFKPWADPACKKKKSSKKTELDS
ncbi:hypothetical protein PYW07_015645 [Mythimna separata]|uniref:Peroxidase n=1 Tax=Mythimna separata TaxID=271217 RepID=A0AAD7YZC8_MYTSE|nr:hypothetical protein PYW07_015645 [Mythimna separata]